MCSAKHLAPTLTLVLLASACSSGKSQVVDDAATDAREADKPADSRFPDAAGTRIDSARNGDVGMQDAAGLRDAAGTERGADVGDVATDRRDSGQIEPDLAELRDMGGIHDSAGPSDAATALAKDADRDTVIGLAKDTATDTVMDTARDMVMVKDTSMDTARLDVPAEAPAPDVCASPIVISMDLEHVDLPITTRGASHHFDLSCATGGADVILSFMVLQPELVYADTFGATWNTILSFSSDCPMAPLQDPQVDGAVTCNDDACNTTQSQIVGVFQTGIYYIVVSGANGESGDATLHFQHAPVGGGIVAALPVGTGSISGTTSGRGRMSDVCEAPGPEDSYWWMTCPDYAGGSLAASTCHTNTSFDTYLALQVPRTELVSCVDDTDGCGRLSTLNTPIPAGAGINVLTIDGGGSPLAAGAYQFTYTRP
jgi:hypothetical protein